MLDLNNTDICHIKTDTSIQIKVEIYVCCMCMHMVDTSIDRGTNVNKAEREKA